MPNKDRERWRRKQKEKRKQESIDRRMVGGANDLTPHNAEALINVRDSKGKVPAGKGYVIKFK